MIVKRLAGGTLKSVGIRGWGIRAAGTSRYNVAGKAFPKSKGAFAQTVLNDKNERHGHNQHE